MKSVFKILLSLLSLSVTVCLPAVPFALARQIPTSSFMHSFVKVLLMFAGIICAGIGFVLFVASLVYLWDEK